MNIRKIIKEDFEEVISLVMQNMNYHMKLNKFNWESIANIRKEELKELRKDFNSSKTKIFVAERDKKIIGYINFSFLGKSPYTKTKKKGVINDLFILGKYRRKGVGEALVREARLLFKSRGIKNVTISVISSNFSTLRFYEKIGFKEYVKKMELAFS